MSYLLILTFLMLTSAGLQLYNKKITGYIIINVFCFVVMLALAFMLFVSGYQLQKANTEAFDDSISVEE